jgi:hypothetical protein
MRVIRFRWGNTGVALRKSSKDMIIAQLKNDQVPFIIKGELVEPVTMPCSLDGQLLTHLKWAIAHYFGCKKND